MRSGPRTVNNGTDRGTRRKGGNELHYHRGGSGWRLVCGIRVDTGDGAPRFTSDAAVFRRAAQRCAGCVAGA